MGKPLQTVSMKDLILIIKSFSGKLTQKALADKLSDITKEYLKNNDKKRYKAEKEKALKKMKTGKDAGEVDDAEWEALSAKTISRLLNDQTTESYTAALEAHPLMELMRDLCADYFEFNFDRMAGHTLRQLKEKGYDTGHLEELLQNDASYKSDDFMFDLVRYAVASGQGNTAEQAGKAVKASPPVKAGPVPEDPGFDPRLLADIVVEKNWRWSRYYWLANEGSPLAQLLWEWEGERFFLLFGELDSGVAGAGKTTAMRHLLQEKAFRNAAYIPLWEVYNPFGMRRMEHEKGTPRVLEWLKRQGATAETNVPRLLLLDGLDEIPAGAGIREFCDDLTELAADDRFTLVLSSVIPPEQLPNWSTLRDISSLLSRFVKCWIQPMRADQRLAILGDTALDYPQELTTPHLVGICRDASLAAAEPKNLFFRWVSEEEVPEHGAALFYRFLAAQICRWFRVNPVSDGQNERDSFVLMFALPAVAFHMAVAEIYDSRYTPEVHSMDSKTVDRLLRLAFPVYKRSLHRYIPYQRSGTALSALADSMQSVGAEGLLNEKSGAILNRRLDPETMEYSFRLTNPAMRNGLAALHLANLFCAAQQNLLPAGAEFDEFYACPVRFLPHNILESAAVLVDERLQEYGESRWMLEYGPNSGTGGSTPFCRYLFCSLGAAFSTALHLDSEEKWRTAAEQAYAVLLCREPQMAEHCVLDHAANLCVQSRMLREKGAYPAAAEKVRASIRFAGERRLLHADGCQALAMLCLTQVKDGMNLQRVRNDCETGLLQADIAKAHEIFEELQRLAQLPEGGELQSAVFGPLPAESVSLIPDCLCLLEKAKLRLDAYQTAGFFGSEEVKFLLTASFVGKAHSVWAALCPAVSGAALNLLAGFFENDQELRENDPALPFFAANPQFHLPIDAEKLAYPERECRAARLYLRIIRLRRGLQPYSCRNLAQSLLSRRFRLDENERPIPAEGVERNLSLTELRFLAGISTRAATRLRPTYAIPRIRWLHERMDSLSGQKGKETEIAACREEAAALFRKEWKLGNCGDKLNNRTDTKADLLAVMLAGLYREGYLPEADPTSWMAKIEDYHLRQKNAPKRYTLGDSFR